jgi:hypothetical protein
MNQTIGKRGVITRKIEREKERQREKKERGCKRERNTGEIQKREKIYDGEIK